MSSIIINITNNSYDDFFSVGGGNLGSKIDKLKSVYGDSYTLLMLTGSFLMVISILMIILSMLLGGVNKRAEGKENIYKTLLGGIILFAFSGIMQLLINIVISLG